MALFQDVLEAFFPAKKGDKPQPKKEPILTSIAPEEAQQDDTNITHEFDLNPFDIQIGSGDTI